MNLQNLKATKLVILESPFAGDVETNITYARLAMRDSLFREEAPMVSHLLYTQEGVLNDDISEEREYGINAGLAWGLAAEKTVVYIDRGISNGMKYGIERAKKEGRPIEFRSIAEKYPEFKSELTVEQCEAMFQELTV